MIIKAGQQARADLFGLGAVICWSTVATAFKLTLRYLTPAQLLLFSAAVSWFFLGAVLVRRGMLRQAFHELKQRRARALLMGLLNPCLYYLILLQAYNMLPAQEAQAINFTWALTISVLAVPFLGHSLRLREVIAVLISYCGVLIIATRGDPLSLRFASPVGVGLALLSTFLWAFYWLLGTRDKIEPVTGLFLNFTFAIPLLIAYCFVTGELKEIAWIGLPGILYIGIFEMGLTFVLWLKAMRLTASTTRTANLIFIAPPLSLVFIFLVLGEPILASTLAGLALILSGLALQRLHQTRKVKL